jgi:hypothetical protein
MKNKKGKTTVNENTLWVGDIDETIDENEVINWFDDISII